MSKIKLGNKVKDIVTGMSGTATARTKYLNGTTQVLIKPEGVNNDGKSMEGEWVDVGQVVYVDNGVTNDVATVEQTKTNIKLGDLVEHFSGFKGTTTERIEYLNGCVYFGVTPKAKEENVLPDTKYLPTQYLSKLDKRVKVKKDDAGGPPSMAPKS